MDIPVMELDLIEEEVFQSQVVHLVKIVYCKYMNRNKKMFLNVMIMFI